MKLYTPISLMLGGLLVLQSVPQPPWMAQFENAPVTSSLCSISGTGDQAAALTSCLARSDVSTGTPTIIDCPTGATKMLINSASVKLVSGGTYKLLSTCHINAEYTNTGFTGKFMNTDLTTPIAHLEWYNRDIGIDSGYAAAPGRMELFYTNNYTLIGGHLDNTNGADEILGANGYVSGNVYSNSNPAGGNPAFKIAGNCGRIPSTFNCTPEAVASTVNTDGTARLKLHDGNYANIEVINNQFSAGDAVYQVAPIQANATGVPWSNVGTYGVIFENNSRITVTGQEGGVGLIAANISHFKGGETITVSGSPTIGDQLQATLTAPCAGSGCGSAPNQTGIAGSPVTVSYTLTSTDPTAAAAGLAASINANQAIAASGVVATSSGAVVTASWGFTTGNGAFLIAWATNVIGTTTLTGVNTSPYYAVDIAEVEFISTGTDACGYAEGFNILNQYNTSPHKIGEIYVTQSLDCSYAGSGPTGSTSAVVVAGLDNPGFPSPIDGVHLTLSVINALGRDILVQGDVSNWDCTGCSFGAPRQGTQATVTTLGDTNGSIIDSTIAALASWGVQIGSPTTPSAPSVNFTMKGTTLTGIINAKAGLFLGDVAGATIGASGAGNGNIYQPALGTTTALGIKMQAEPSGNPTNSVLTFNDVSLMTAAAPISFVCQAGNSASSNPGSVNYGPC